MNPKEAVRRVYDTIVPIRWVEGPLSAYRSYLQRVQSYQDFLPFYLGEFENARNNPADYSPAAAALVVRNLINYRNEMADLINGGPVLRGERRLFGILRVGEVFSPLDWMANRHTVT